MRVAVAGSSGLIGTALCADLTRNGHTVLRIVRNRSANDGEIAWNPTVGTIDLAPLAGVDAIVNLAGAGVGDHRWTDEYKRLIRQSRVDSTRTIALAAAQVRPSVLINASAIGFYGDTGESPVDENSPGGSGFLSSVVSEWEASTAAAADAGVRVVRIRTGLVVSRNGGAWQKLYPIVKLGLGGPMGSGNQWWSYISLRDQIAAIRFLMERQDIHGAVNLTAPYPARNRDVVKAMGKVLHRPTLLPVPAFALRAVLGEFSVEVLGSARVLPGVLTRSGFEFRDPDVHSAMRTLIQR